MELSSRFGVRWTKALPSSFSTADLAETWCRTSARCFRPPPAGGARAAFLTGHEGVFHPHVRFWSAVGFHYSLSRFPSFDHSRRLFTSLTSLLSVAPSRFPRVCISPSPSSPHLLPSFTSHQPRGRLSKETEEDLSPWFSRYSPLLFPPHPFSLPHFITPPSLLDYIHIGSRTKVPVPLPLPLRRIPGYPA